MRLLRYLLLLALCGLAWAADNNADGAKTGYIDCSSTDSHPSVYPNLCANRPFLRVECGEKVVVLGRESSQDGQWLKIKSAHGFRRYIRANFVSQEPDRFVAFDVSSVPELDPPNCGTAEPRVDRDVRQPRLISQVMAEFSDEARKKHIDGVVVLSLVVGLDGLPHDIKIEKSLGYGLDENAVHSVEQYRFEPGQRDGQPVEMPIHVEVAFHLADQKR